MKRKEDILVKFWRNFIYWLKNLSQRVRSDKIAKTLNQTVDEEFQKALLQLEEE